MTGTFCQSCYIGKNIRAFQTIWSKIILDLLNLLKRLSYTGSVISTLKVEINQYSEPLIQISSHRLYFIILKTELVRKATRIFLKYTGYKPI